MCLIITAKSSPKASKVPFDLMVPDIMLWRLSLFFILIEDTSSSSFLLKRVVLQTLCLTACDHLLYGYA